MTVINMAKAWAVTRRNVSDELALEFAEWCQKHCEERQSFDKTYAELWNDWVERRKF